MSNFPFISDRTLQVNLDTALDHINELVLLTESTAYKKLQISSFRKTIIIHTAALIEAVLLWKLTQTCNSEKIQLEDKWKYLDIKVIFTVNDNEEIIAGKRIKETKDMKRL